MKNAGQYVEYGVPYGYKKKKDDKHQIEIDDDVADNIRLIFNMYVNGSTGLQIARYLNDKKIRTPSSYMKMKNMARKWRAETVNDILTNPFYQRQYSD